MRSGILQTFRGGEALPALSPLASSLLNHETRHFRCFKPLALRGLVTVAPVNEHTTLQIPKDPPTGRGPGAPPSPASAIPHRRHLAGRHLPRLELSLHNRTLPTLPSSDLNFKAYHCHKSQ